MKYVKDAGTFTNEDLSCSELIAEINDCVGIIRAYIDAGNVDAAQTLVEEVEGHLLPVLNEKIGKMLLHIATDVAEKDKL